MSDGLESRDIASEILSWVDLELISCTNLQTLWAGYGHICAIRARPLAKNGEDGNEQSLILKIVSPPPGRLDESHLRKVFSYEVEQYFYQEVAPSLGDLPLAKCLVSTSTENQSRNLGKLNGLTATLLTDLRLQYPIAGEKRAVLTSTQVYSAIRWLAEFHSSCWKQPKFDLQSLILPPLQEGKRREAQQDSTRRGLWLNGGYTYLATRREEYNALAQDHDSEWSRAFCRPIEGTSSTVAELAAEFLTPTGRDVETYIHGDVKSENLFATSNGDQVAFFDFQYAGLGLGVCDLAKLLTCSVPVDMLVASRDIPSELSMGEGERRLLKAYRDELLRGSKTSHAPAYDWDDFKRHWETALVDWCRFQASWGFWGNTDWLQARVRSILRQGEWLKWITNRQDNMASG